MNKTSAGKSNIFFSFILCESFYRFFNGAKKGRTYFKIQGTYFKISQTYFSFSQR